MVIIIWQEKVVVDSEDQARVQDLQGQLEQQQRLNMPLLLQHLLSKDLE